MPTICRVYLISEGKTEEFIVNFSNVAFLLQEHKEVSEIVVVGPFDNHFVLSIKKGRIVYCSDDAVKKSIESEMKAVNFVTPPKLHSYTGIIQYVSTRTINIVSTSIMQAKEDIKKWTDAPLIKIA